jgi:hypothetical protein
MPVKALEQGWTGQQSLSKAAKPNYGPHGKIVLTCCCADSLEDVEAEAELTIAKAVTMSLPRS